MAQTTIIPTYLFCNRQLYQLILDNRNFVVPAYSCGLVGTQWGKIVFEGAFLFSCQFFYLVMKKVYLNLTLYVTFIYRCMRIKIMFQRVSLLTPEDIWFRCDLYLRFIPPINLWKICIDLRPFSKCFRVPFSRTLRSPRSNNLEIQNNENSK